MVDLPFVDAKVHSELVSDKVKRLLRVDQFLKRGVTFNLSVQGGILDGLASEVYARKYVIGQSLDSDTVLLDERIIAQHLELHFKASAFGPVVSVKALGAGASIDDEEVAPGESSKFFSLPVRVSLFDTVFEITPHRNEKIMISKEMRNSLYRARYAMTVAVVGILGWQLAQSSAFHFELALGTPELPYDIVQSEQHDTERFTRVTQAVEQKLDELGLASHVTAQVNNTGALRLSGTLQSDKVSEWRAFREWYDESETFVLLSNVNITPRLVNLPAIASIKLTEPPMVILVDGSQVGVGDVFFDDVRLQAIHENHFVLLHQNEEMMVSFSGEEVNDG